MLNRKTTMSIKEFCELQRGELSLKEIEYRRRRETLERNKLNIIKWSTTSLLASYAIRMQNKLVIPSSTLAYVSEGVSAPKGLRFFLNNIITNIEPISISIVILIAIYQILNAELNGNDKEVLYIIARYAVVIALMHFAPSIFNVYISTVGRYLR